MNDERQRQIREFEDMIEKGELYQGHRGLLAMRALPVREVPAELVDRIAPLLRPSARAMDPGDPVGAVAASIRGALADLLPAASLRSTRALVRPGGGGVETVFELLQANAGEQGFRTQLADMRFSDALDVSWTAAGPIELRPAQELLERLAAAVSPAAPMRFSSYAEPRYRSALQLHLGGIAARAAYGGILAARPESAHIRILLEPWAEIQGGRAAKLADCPPL